MQVHRFYVTQQKMFVIQLAREKMGRHYIPDRSVEKKIKEHSSMQ